MTTPRLCRIPCANYWIAPITTTMGLGQRMVISTSTKEANDNKYSYSTGGEGTHPQLYIHTPPLEPGTRNPEKKPKTSLQYINHVDRSRRKKRTPLPLPLPLPLSSRSTIVHHYFGHPPSRSRAILETQFARRCKKERHHHPQRSTDEIIDRFRRRRRECGVGIIHRGRRTDNYA